MNLFSIAASDMDVIIGIIAIVGWILSQIFSKKKTGPSQAEGSAPEAGAPIDPRDELKKFFAELEKASNPQPTPPPIAPPPLQKKVQRDKPAHRNSESRTETLSSKHRPAFSATESTRGFQPVATPAFVSTTLAKPLQPLAMPELRNPHSLRKFIIVNEILGKPIALRQG